MNRLRGFSFVEIVVVMVIAGILAAFAVPRLTDSESKATWFNEQAKAGVRYAQRQAVAQRRLVFVEIQPAQIALCYAPYVANCALNGTPLTQITTGQAYVLPAPSGVAIIVQTGTNPFSFNGLGQPSTSMALTISGGTLTVNAETGYVQ
jgi:MSHA pilin protein MshC